jgi:hypothetical protein
MQFFVSKFRWFMLLTGLVTFSLVLVMFTPQESLTRMFGDTASGSTTDIIVPHWASLIALMGIMLIYGAFKSSLRNFVLVIVTINKIIFVVLVLTSSSSYLKHGAGTAVIIDSVMILFYGCLPGVGKNSCTTTAARFKRRYDIGWLRQFGGCRGPVKKIMCLSRALSPKRRLCIALVSVLTNLLSFSIQFFNHCF